MSSEVNSETKSDEIQNKENIRLGFGCMRFPHDKNLTEKLISAAVEKGITYFDTAYVYPGSEKTLGDIVFRNNLRNKIQIATKLPLFKTRTREDMTTLFEDSLSRLKTDYIDFYLMHNLSTFEEWERLKGLGVLGFIEKEKKAGRIKKAGFSFHGTRQTFIKLIDDYDWDFCQIQYNYMNETYQAGTYGLDYAKSKGIPVIIMEPLLGGRLIGGLPKKAAEILKENSVTPAEFAFRWLYNQDGVDVVLSGMNGMDMLFENIAIAESKKIYPAELYDEVKDIFSESYKVPCTGCNYCMPCPVGVSIPSSFTAYNSSFAISKFTGLQLYLTSVSSGVSAKKCINCGKCKSRCPQHIDIPTELTRVVSRLEPWYVSMIMNLIRGKKK
ncbi:MAG: aldo/keto reductase [Ruminococcus sp.]|nr:aldo/keto reductase [Ruminococcus sp.]